MRRLRVAVLVASAVLVSSLASAQQGSIIGIAVDDTKAVLPGVSVTATDQEAGRQIAAVTNEKGEYRLSNMPAGKYTIQAELSGFTTVVLRDVEILVGQNATIPITMKLASVTETLTVVGETPLVDVASSQVAGNVDRRQMEQLPLQGRNWMELSKLVKGVTANDIGNSIGTGAMDDLWQLNLDGQQITQKVAGSGFGQPRFSRESIAEFQIVTNMFDITQGRSAGMEIQAISKSGTNNLSGNVYGYFRDDSLNSPDLVANKVLPYANQQIGGTLGGPIVKDRIHYFASYEYEREPGTTFANPSLLPAQTFSIPYQNGQKSFLARVDDQLTTNDRLSVRASRWNWANPYLLPTGDHPSHASDQTKDATNVLGTWSSVMGAGNRILEIKGGYNGFHWTNAPQDELLGTREYRVPGLNFGAPYNYPQTLNQNNWTGRADFSVHKEKHDLKMGGEYIHVHNGGPWFIQRQGFFTFNSAPPVMGVVLPPGSGLDPSLWNLAPLNPVARDFQINFAQNEADWTIDVPRPTYAVWLGDNWRVSSQLTVNLGVRWDADPNMASPPNIRTNDIIINNGIPQSYSHQLAGTNDYGYKTDIRDWKNIAPRAGFTYNVGGNNDLVIRGGSGLYFASPVSNVTFSPQFYSHLVAATFVNDGRADYITNPTNGVTADQIFAGQVKTPPQTVRTIATDFKSPYTWQSSIGFQKQLNAVTGFDVDLTHWNEYRDTRTIDANLAYNPATGYNLANGSAPVRPNPAYAGVFQFVSDGKRDQTAIASSITRRLKNKIQAGLTYTLMLEMKDNGTVGYGTAPANNPFDYLDGEWATSQDFQRNTLRTWALVQLPYGFSTSVTYFYGSGNRFNDTIGVAPFGKTGTNRLNLTATGAATSAITIPAAVLDRWDGPAVINSGDVIPRNALGGLPLHKVDLHVTKDIRLARTTRVQLVAEVFNLFNHANFGSYNTTLSATSAATTALFGTPNQNPGTAFVSRQAQLGFKLAF
ncbi:MAG TPA: carboxypeptidase-like regulatory domain-containing protein [Vicinamibacterales bacterium]|nr:carboxypeptidase-like regulatory domain-containing protein [Vicinamibacterales bacterium]